MTPRPRTTRTTQRKRQTAFTTTTATASSTAGPSSSTGNGGGPPPRRRRARVGVAALREIRFYQRSTQNLVQKKPFQLLVRKILHSLRGDEFTRFTSEALAAIQVAAEMYVVEIFEEVNLYAIHAKRVTIQDKDIKLCERIREMHGIGLSSVGVSVPFARMP